MKYAYLFTTISKPLANPLSLDTRASGAEQRLEKIIGLGSYLFGPSFPLAGLADRVAQWMKATTDPCNRHFTVNKAHKMMATDESRIYIPKANSIDNTAAFDAVSGETASNRVQGVFRLKEAGGFVNGPTGLLNRNKERQHGHLDDFHGRAKDTFNTSSLRKLEPEDKRIPAIPAPELLWTEAEQLAQIACWKFDVETGEFSYSDHIHKLLWLPENKPLNHFLSLLPCFPEPDAELLSQSWKQAFYFGRQFQLTSRLSHINEAVWIKLDVKPLCQEGKLVRIIGTLQDVTDFRENETRLMHEKSAAEQAAKHKAEFVSLISHELRTPLNAIMGLTYLLQQDEHMAEENKDYLQSIHFSSQNMLSIINSTLDFSRIEAGKVELEKVNFQLHDLLTSVHRSFMVRAAEKRLEFALRIDETLPEEVAGDPGRLTQVLNNLTSNAIRFTERGSVTLSAEVVYKSDSDWIVEFSVTDTGVGIPEERQQDIFESYVQASASTHRQYGGTGLGLAITKKIVELHKGSITLNSTLGIGSTFSVRLRFVKPQPAYTTLKKECLSVTKEAKLKDVKILVVDDNDINRMVAGKLLQGWQAKVDTAEDATTALEKLKATAYDLVLMDLHMPGINGFEAITQIRRSGMNMPVIALTANASEEEKQTILAIGGNDYITKPFTPQMLCNTLLQHL